MAEQIVAVHSVGNGDDFVIVREPDGTTHVGCGTLKYGTTYGFEVESWLLEFRAGGVLVPGAITAEVVFLDDVDLP